MKSTKMLTILVLALAMVVCLAQVGQAEPIGTAWTYQGRLMDKNKPADGLYDFQFKLYDSNDPNTGTQLGSPIDINDLDVIDGHFVVELDFGSGIFDGNAVWLETMVVESPLGSDPAALSPLSELTPTPYALYAASGPGVPVPLALSGPVASPGAVISGTNTAGGSGIYGENASTGNYGRLGTNVDGVYGRSSASGGSGVAGVNTGVGNGVYGRSNNGKGVHGVSSDGLAGYFNGDVTLTKPSGQGGGELVLRTATYNEPGRYRIRFANNGLGLFAGDDTQNQQFSFVSKWGAIREYDARLSVHGKASGSWGTYIAFTHDGTDGLIETDVGDIVLSPAGNVGIGTTSPSGSLYPNSKTLEVEGIAPSIVLDDTDGTIQDDFEISNGGDKVLFRDATDNVDLLTIGLSGTIAGNVGIGTTSPGTKLDVNGQVKITGGSPGAGKVLTSDASGLASWQTPAGGGDNLGNHIATQNIRLNGHWLSGDGGNEGVFVDNVGNVGIGTTSPTRRLKIISPQAAAIWLESSSTNTYIQYKASGTSILPAVGANGDDLIIIAGGSERFRIKNNGNVGIGTTSPTGKLDVRGDEVRIWDGAASVGWAISQGELYVERDLEVDGRIFVLDVYNTGVSGRGVYVASNGELGYVTSSKRYKENIAPLNDDFSKILDAQPVTFTAKESKERGIGFIAEDMDELGLSNLVIYDPQGRPESVRYDWISLYLLEVIKDQVRSIKELKMENESLNKQLRAENQSLKQRFDALERTIQQLAKGKEVQL